MMDLEGQSFDVQSQLASNSMYDLSSQIRKLRKLFPRADSAVLGREMAVLGSQCAKASNAVGSVTAWPRSELNGQQVKLQAELSHQLDTQMHGVRQIQTSITEKLRAQQQQHQHHQHHQQQQQTPHTSQSFSERTPLLDPSTGPGGGSGSSQLQQQVLDELDQADIDLHGALINDRDAEISEIHRGMREINSIFQDIGVLVTQQGQQLDTIEDNLADIAQQTESAGRQLVKAENYQRGRGKWTCIALGVLLVITILVGLNVVGRAHR